MGRFEECLSFVLRWEGGFSDNPLDPGGATNCGITQKVYDAYRRRVGLPRRSVAAISREEVNYLYYHGYFVPAGCAEAPAPLDLALFDTAVNCGVGRARDWLRVAQGLAGGGAAPTELARRVIDQRVNHYYALARNPLTRGWARRFLDGWLNRARALKQAVGY